MSLLSLNAYMLVIPHGDQPGDPAHPPAQDGSAQSGPCLAQIWPGLGCLLPAGLAVNQAPSSGIIRGMAKGCWSIWHFCQLGRGDALPDPDDH